MKRERDSLRNVGHPYSSWRWPSDDAFREEIRPRHINEVNFVSQSWGSRAYVATLERFFENLREFEHALEGLEEIARTKQPEPGDPTVQELCIDLGHHGEMLLLLQHGLAGSRGAYSFCHGKDAISHAAWREGERMSRHDVRQLISDARELNDDLRNSMNAADEFPAFAHRSLPVRVEADLLMARDLYSIGFDDVALLVLGRAFERVIRTVLEDRSIVLTNGKNASESTLFDAIAALEKLRWAESNQRLLSKTQVQMLQWLRTIRNEQVHDASVEEQNPRDLAPILIGAMESLYKIHKDRMTDNLVS